MHPRNPWKLRLWPQGDHGAIAAAAAEWRQTFDAIDTPLVVLDAHDRLARLNAAAQRLLGLEFKDLLGRTLESIAPWEPWNGVTAAAREARARAASVSCQVRGERSKAWQVSASVVPAEVPDARRVIVLARDVTDLVGLEGSLRRAEAMAQLGALVAGVAHEVRNPLFAISATTDALESRTAGREDLAPFTAALRGEVARLSRLTRDLLEYGRPAALDLEEVELGELVPRALRSLEALAAERRVAIRNLVRPELARVRVDAGRVAQVVQNLVDNALRLSPAGAEVEVRGDVVDSRERRRVELAVADRGPGFPEADRHRVFEPFFTGRQGGTGLGLAIVSRIVEDHGGAVEVLDRPGGGAVVGFWLPMSEPRTGDR